MRPHGPDHALADLHFQAQTQSEEREECSYCNLAYSALACFRKREIGVGVFPEGQKVLVGGERPDAGGVGIGSL